MDKIGYIKAGGNPQGQRVQTLLAQTRERATQDWQARQAVAAEARPLWAKKAADFAGKALSWIAISFTIAGLPVGLALATIGLVVAEVVAVHEGFLVITEQLLAVIYSVVTVLAYVALLFVRESMHEKASITHVVRGLLWTIVLFGLLGRLSIPLQKYSAEAWGTAIVKIATESNLQTLIGFIGAPVATYALLIGTEFSVRYIYGRYVGVTGGDDSRFLVIESLTETLEKAESEFWKVQVELLRNRQP